MESNEQERAPYKACYKSVKLFIKYSDSVGFHWGAVLLINQMGLLHIYKHTYKYLKYSLN